MTLALKPAHLRRYKDLLKLFFKYGRGDLVRDAELDGNGADPEPTAAATAKAEEFGADLEAMGPTFIKLGQLLSTRTDLLPPAYIQSLSRLRDHVEPVPGEEILQTIEEELGVKVSRAFPEFRPLSDAARALRSVPSVTKKS